MIKLKPFKYAVFDMDGTILESMHIWDAVIGEYLDFKGKVPEEKLREEIRALNMFQTADYLIDRYGISMTSQEIVDELNEFVLRRYLESAGIKPGAAEYLKYLKENGVKICLVTATDRMIIEPVFEKYDILKYFDNIMPCTEEGLDKNTPEIYFRGVKSIGASGSEDCIIFEDAVHCIKTVTGAGFYTVAVLDRSSQADWSIITELADEHIASYDEIER